MHWLAKYTNTKWNVHSDMHLEVGFLYENGINLEAMLELQYYYWK